MAFEAWLLLNLSWMSLANFKPKRTVVASIAQCGRTGNTASCCRWTSLWVISASRQFSREQCSLTA